MVFGLACLVLDPEASDVTPEFTCGKSLLGVITERESEDKELLYVWRGYGIVGTVESLGMLLMEPMPLTRLSLLWLVWFLLFSIGIAAEATDAFDLLSGR